MRFRKIELAVIFAMLMISPLAHSQATPPKSPAANDQVPTPGDTADADDWGHPIVPVRKGQKSAPAPKHDISGTWDPGIDPEKVLGITGASAMPEDGNPAHQLPYTALGREMLSHTNPANGARSVLPANTDDPVVYCDPQGMPREDLYELRTTRILQTPKSVYVLYQYGKIWRIIWTDGRELPKDPDPRWFGYSVGKWADDYTFVVETSGINDKPWIDRAGRPHSDELKIEERFHRVDQDHLELTIKITDPKVYTKPWVAADKTLFQLQDSGYDVREMLCSPSEFAEYNKLVGKPISADPNKK